MTQLQQVGLNDVRRQFVELRETYQAALPKVDPALINDMLEKEMISKEPQSYTLEVFTKEGIDVEAARQYILDKTGMAPAIYDNGTHYVTDQKLTLEMVKEINDSDDVVEIRGTFCGATGMKASYYHRRT